MIRKHKYITIAGTHTHSQTTKHTTHTKQQTNKTIKHTRHNQHHTQKTKLHQPQNTSTTTNIKHARHKPTQYKHLTKSKSHGCFEKPNTKTHNNDTNNINQQTQT